MRTHAPLHPAAHAAHASLLALAAPLALLAAGCRDWDRERPPEGGTPVTTEVVRPAPFRPSLLLLGTVRPAGTIPVAAPRAGLVRYPARFTGGLTTGAAVRSGEALAIVESEAARLAVAEARLLADLAAGERERARRAAGDGLLAKAELEQKETAARLALERLASAEREAGRLTIRAPRSGTLVVARAYPEGTDLPAGTLLAELATGGAPRVELVAAASERERLRPGLKVTFRAPGGERLAGAGTLVEVASVVDASGTVRAVASVTDARGLPVPGEGVEAAVSLEPRPAAITVPEEALVLGSSGAALFVVERADGWPVRLRARRVAVETGVRGEGRVEVTRGLREGERVAVTGAALLTDGAPAVDASMAASR